MQTIDLDWPSSTLYVRKSVVIPPEGVVLRFTVPMTEKPRPGVVVIEGQGSKVSAVLSLPGGAPLAIIPDSLAPRLNFAIGKAQKYFPTAALGETYYVTVKSLRGAASHGVYVDLIVYAPYP